MHGSKSDISSLVFPISINDLNDRYFDGEPLSKEELMAITNYNKYRIAYLNSAKDNAEFDKRYLELQAKANLADYKEFLELD